MQPDIDITGIDKAVLLAALYNHATKRQTLDGSSEFQLSIEEARVIVAARTYAKGCGWRSSFDYLRGRILKCDIGGDLLDAYDANVYDHHNGTGRCIQAIEFARRGMLSHGKL